MRNTTVLLVLGVLITASQATAAVGKTWTSSGPADLFEGKLEGVSLLSTGEIELAPAVEKIEGLEAEIVWDVEASSDGSVYIATGGPAAVYAVEGNRAVLLHKSDQKHVLSLLPMDDGSVLAATAPGGIIFRINRRGKVTTFADLDAAYVWDMVHAPRNRIYCATGPEGQVIELNRAGQATEVLKVKQQNFMCVATAPDGRLYAGTAPDGLLFRIQPDGKALVVYDADEDEIRDIVVDEDGVVYACTAQSQQGPPRGGPPGGSRPERSGPDEAPPITVPPATGAPSAQNSVYRIVPGEGATLMARFERMFVLSLELLGDEVLAGTGTGGRVMALLSDSRSRVLTQLEDSHVTAMAALPEGAVYIGTSNSGGLYRMGPAAGKEGTFLSKPFDAEYLAKWGRIWWEQVAGEGQSVRIRVRTGNTTEPDEHWSGWSEWALDATGSALAVPMGRFAQFAAELASRTEGDTPQLLEVSVSYQQANRRPLIVDFAVDGESVLNGGGNGESGGRRPSSGSSGRTQRGPSGPPGQLTLAWKASDPNGDELVFDIYYRALDETDWKEIELEATGQPGFKWEAGRVPDGRYLLKLIASDRLERAPGEALTHERVSRPVVIDSRRPQVVDLAAERMRDGTWEIVGIARDNLSHIEAIEVSRNGKEWTRAFPTDGLLDSSEEAFSFRTDALDPGENVFVIAATDQNQNTGTGKLVVLVEAGGD
jgi:hypothetical protein